MPPTREGVGLLDSTAFSRYEITGAGRARLARPAAGLPLPARRRARLAPMLSAIGQAAGRSHGVQLGRPHLLADGLLLSAPVAHALVRRAICPTAAWRCATSPTTYAGFGAVRPDVRASCWRALTDADVSQRGVPLHAAAARWTSAWSWHEVGRLSVAGELGYEINVPVVEHRALYDTLLEAGRRSRPRARSATTRSTACGWKRASASGRASSRKAYTPGMCGLDRFVAFDKGELHRPRRGAAERDGDIGQAQAGDAGGRRHRCRRRRASSRSGTASAASAS